MEETNRTPKKLPELLAIEIAFYLMNVVVLSLVLYPFVHKGFVGMGVLFALPLLAIEHFLLLPKLRARSDWVFVGVTILIVVLIWVSSQIGHLR